jgi:multicomponent K+:H+ antiporter subunit E
MNDRAQRRFYPLTSLMLLAVWLLLNDTVAPGHVVLGTILALAIPLFARRFWPETATLQRPRLAARFAARVLGDILVANVVVARQILWSAHALRPGFVRVPLELSSEAAITAFASVISLTPGTVSVDVDPQRRFLLVHALDLDDEQGLIDELKTRYEAPIKAILT